MESISWQSHSLLTAIVILLIFLTIFHIAFIKTHVNLLAVTVSIGSISINFLLLHKVLVIMESYTLSSNRQILLQTIQC